MRSLPPQSLRPVVLMPTAAPPGAAPRAGIAAVGAAATALVLASAAAALGAHESPSGLINGTVGFVLFAHRALLAFSAASALSAIVLATLAWPRARSLSLLAAAGALVWVVAVAWARFGH